jgi:SSS family solute:Na+ symporter
MTWIDATVIVVYMLGMIAVGLATRGKQETADDYFIAGGMMRGWLSTLIVGLSIAATLFSGISFIFYPAETYRGGLVLFMGVAFVSMPVAYFVLRSFLPRYLATGVTHPYETIERKFGPSTRTVASLMYASMRVGWLAALIYAPTLAIMAAGRLSPGWFWPVVLATGLVSTLYTVFGGIRGVIVTDALQFIVIIAGIAATFLCVWLKLPVPFSEAVTSLYDAGRLNFLPLSLDPTAKLTVWTVAIGVTVANLANYIGDQMSLQRYLATGDTKTALHTFAVNVVGVILVLALLTSVGLAMFVFYRFVPDTTRPENIDQIFPHFIAHELPVGISGLVLAAILAATMSSMTSGINALAATVTLDLMPRIARPLTSTEQLRFAKACSCVVGVVSTLLAGVVNRLGTLFDLSQIILGVFAGPLLIVVLLSVVDRRISPRGMIAGLLLGCLAGSGVALSPVASLWTAPVSAGCTLLIALLWPAKAEATV